MDGVEIATFCGAGPVCLVAEAMTRFLSFARHILRTGPTESMALPDGTGNIGGGWGSLHAGSKVLTALGLRLRSAQEHFKYTNPSSPERRARGLLLRLEFAGACLALIVRTAARARARHSNALLPSGPRAHYRCNNSIGALPSLPRLLPTWLARAWLLGSSRIERANQPVCTPLPLASLINCRTLCATKGRSLDARVAGLHC